MTFFVFPSSSFIGRSHPVEPFSFTGAIGISDGCCFGANSGYYARSLCFYTIYRLYDRFSSAWLYLFIYIVIVLYSYILIYLYRYCAICLLLYCMLAAWGYYFLYIYILFLSLTSTSIFYDSGCRLSIIWLFTMQRYGGSVRYQTPGDALFG